MGTGCLRNKGDPLRHHPPEFIHFVPPLASVLLRVAVPAHRHQVREIESDGRVAYVLRGYVGYVVDSVSRCIDPALETDLTESTRLLEI